MVVDFPVGASLQPVEVFADEMRSLLGVHVDVLVGSLLDADVFTQLVAESRPL